MNLNIKAPLNGFLGYGACSINITKALYNLGIDVSIMPIGQPYLTTNDNELFSKLINERFDKFDVNAPSLTIFHEFSFFDALQSKKEIIGFPFFELDEMDMVRRKSLNCLDRLFVASEWAREICSNYYKGQIDIVPLGVDTSIFSPDMKVSSKKTYKFFTIGKIEKRKCTDLLPRIFAKAFEKSDNVEFHIMCDSPLPQIKQQMPTFKDFAKNSKLGDKIFIHDLKKTDYELADFIKSMDCGVFLTRAEGWGLPILQSLACNKPIITTDYSAQMEFCNATNSNLVNIMSKEEAIDGIWFHGGGAWASIEEPQLQQCVNYMRNLYKDDVRENSEGVKTANKFTWENTAKTIERLCQ